MKTNDDQSESSATATVRRTDIGTLISHELTEMEMRIDVGNGNRQNSDGMDSDDDNNNNNTRDNIAVTAIKPTSLPGMICDSTSTTIDSTRKRNYGVSGDGRNSNSSSGSSASDMDSNQFVSMKPLQRLFAAQSHAKLDVLEQQQQRRHDECVQIPIDRIELVEDDNGMVIIHDVSAKCFTKCSVSQLY